MVLMMQLKSGMPDTNYLSNPYYRNSPTLYEGWGVFFVMGQIPQTLIGVIAELTHLLCACTLIMTA